MYEDITYESILEGMMERISDELDKREGSLIFYALSPTAYYLIQMYSSLMNYPDLVLPDASAGLYLDRFAALFGVERKAPGKAVRLGKFDIQIPIGSRFTAMGEPVLVYKAIEYAREDSGYFLYEMECEIAGEDGNIYKGNLIPVDYINGLGTAELRDIIAEGTEEESDNSLRERFLAKVQKPSTSGNIYDYYNWAMSCDGVGAAKVFPLADGPGTVKVVITSRDKTAADSSLVKTVHSYIEGVRPIGATVTVASAVEKPVNISAKVRLIEGINLGAVQNAFQESIDRYLQEGAFALNYISLARIGNLLLGAEGVDDYSGLVINGEPDNVIILDEEVVVVGEVRLEVM